MWSSRRTLTPRAGIALRLVLQRGRQLRRGLVPLRLVVDFHVVAVGRGEGIGRAMAEVAVGPSPAAARLLDDGDPVLQRLGARGTVGEVAHAGDLCRGQLQRVVLVVVPAAQVDRLAAPPALGHAEDVDEKAQALLGLGCEKLDVSQVCKIEGADGGLHGIASMDAPTPRPRPDHSAARQCEHLTKRPSASAALGLPTRPRTTWRARLFSYIATRTGHETNCCPFSAQLEPSVDAPRSRPLWPGWSRHSC